MDQIKKLEVSEFKDIASKLSFDEILLAKDYYIMVILFLLKDLEGISFKGGTAIQKIILNRARLSEDIDFTVTGDLEGITKRITTVLRKSGFFTNITKDKDVEGFTRLVIHFKNYSGHDDTIFIDLNKRARLHLKPEMHEIRHFYKESIPAFKFQTLALKEMVAEKVAAAVTRNKPRDHFDLYKIAQRMPIDLSLARKKCRESGTEFSIIKMFNNAKKLKKRWDKDMLPLISEEVAFEEVMKTLARHFGLKKEKEIASKKK
ncbi:MAG: nucleotidyl transferase AbiEii/AbiGii toxin family protein [Candidatus Woesearchaeota archaeon]